MVDIGTSRIKLAIFRDWRLETLKTYRFTSMDGLLEPDYIDEVGRYLDRNFSQIVITGQRASIMGWSGSGDRSLVYTWRSDLGRDILGRVSGDPVASLFIRSGSGAPRIKRLLDMGYEYVGGVETYLTWLMTGRYVVDYSYAYTYGLLDPFERLYSDYLLDLLDIDVDSLPTPVDSYEELIGEDMSITMIPDQSAALYGEDPRLEHCKLTLGSGAFADKAVGETPVGDPDRGVIPIMISPVDGFMAEVYISFWGSSLDRFLSIHGLNYSVLDSLDVELYHSLNIPPILLRGSFYDVEVSMDLDVGIEELAYGMAGAASYIVSLVSSVSDSRDLYIGGGGAVSHFFPEVISRVLDKNVYVRRRPELSTVYGAAAYLIKRMDGDASSFIDDVRPIERVYRGSDDMRWVFEKYVEGLEKHSSLG